MSVRATGPSPSSASRAFLREAGAEARIEEFDAGTPTAEDAAQAVGCDARRRSSSRSSSTATASRVVALVPGDRRADLDEDRRAAGAAKREGRAAREVEAATGFAPGAVAPFPLPRVDRVLIDRTLLAHDVVWVGAGSERTWSRLCARRPRPARARASPWTSSQDSAYHSQPEPAGRSRADAARPRRSG